MTRLLSTATLIAALVAPCGLSAAEPGGRLSMEQLGRMLDDLGLNPKANANKEGKLVDYDLEFQSGTWTMRHWVSISPSGKFIWINTNIAKPLPAEGISVEALLGLLEQNNDVWPAFVYYVKEVRRLRLGMGIRNEDLTPAKLRKDIDTFTESAKTLMVRFEKESKGEYKRSEAGPGPKSQPGQEEDLHRLVDQIRRVGDGKPKPRPEQVPPPPALDKGALRRQVLAWLQENHKDNAEWTEKVRQAAIKDLDAGGDFYFTFGPGVMASGKPYQMHVFAGRFYAIPLTLPQVKKLVSGPNGVTYCGGRRGYKMEPTPRVLVRQPEIANSDNLDPTQKITGQIAFQVRDNLPGKLAVRLSFREGRNFRMLFHHLSEVPSEQRGTLSFSLGPIDDGKEENKVGGPVVMFLDLCTITEEPDPELGGTKVPTVTVISNTVPVVVDLPGKAKDD
jgi:hypothetical protein